jgi:hypothetical protein
MYLNVFLGAKGTPLPSKKPETSISNDHNYLTVGREVTVQSTMEVNRYVYLYHTYYVFFTF